MLISKGGAGMGRYRIDIDSLSYINAKQPVLHDIHITLPIDSFVVIAGKSGCGKTTLLRMLKKQLRPKMDVKGTIIWENQTKTLIEEMNDLESAASIGYVSQQPDLQLVSDQVWHELAFGLENLGMKSEDIHQQLAEVVSFLGLEDIYHTPISHLSGGQKQIVQLAAVLAMKPKVILLDEPTSQLDPIAKQRFYDLLIRIHKEFDIGIIMVGHQLESLLDVCERIIYLEEGTIAYDGKPNYLCKGHITYDALLPYPARYIQQMYPEEKENPVTEKQMRQMIKMVNIASSKIKEDTNTVLRCEHVYLRYQKDSPDVLRDFSIEVKEHEILCLFGGNGSGKTTFLKMLGSKYANKFGKVDIKKRLLYLPQDPRILFVKDSLKEEYAMFSNRDTWIKCFDLEKLLLMHPYDLSGGELQRAALALLLMHCDDECILLLDEPSKGLDMYYREQLAKILKTLTEKHTIIMVSHDVEFAALCADRCGFLFDGTITALKPVRSFMMDNNFYTTYWRRCTRHLTPCAITYEDMIS